MGCTPGLPVQHQLPEPTQTHVLTWQTFVGKVMSLLFNMLSKFVIIFLPGSKCLLISWLQWFGEPKKIKSATVSIFSLSICYEVMGPDAMIFVFWMLSFKPTFNSPLSLSSRGSWVPLHFLPLKWYHLHIWGVFISPGSLDSSLWVIQPGILQDVLCGQENKTYNRSNIVTNSIKSLKMVPIKKSKQKTEAIL